VWATKTAEEEGGRDHSLLFFPLWKKVYKFYLHYPFMSLEHDQEFTQIFLQNLWFASGILECFTA